VARPDLDFDRLIRHLQDRLAAAEAKNEDLERRLNNMFREATVTKVDPDTGMAEVDADGLPSDMVPWITRAGKQKEWDPPSEGERVVLFNPSGEPGLGMIMHGGFSNKFPQNHNKVGEHKRSVGDDVSTTTTDKDKVSKTKKVVVSQNEDNHDLKVGDKVSVVADLEKNVIQVGSTLLASLADKNVSQAAKTVVKQKLLVASGGLLG
jgi:phage baseplate assembly protein V